MRVVVSGIPRPGFQVRVDRGAEWVRAAAEEALGAPPDAVSGALELVARGKRVVATGSVDVAWGAACDRCGEPVQQALTAEIDLSYAPQRDDHGDEVELAADELDVGWYRDGEIDLADVLREAIALAMPARVVCAEASSCDARTRALLDREPAEAPNPSPFAALRQVH